jgi:enoyl-CoA hydratase
MAAGLTYSMGASNAALMLLTGDMIDADKALAWGLVSEVVAPDALLARAQEIAATIASRAPIAAETAKLNLRAAHTMPWEKAIEYERDLQAICFATDDAKEGRAAFAEKRAPVFRRR